MLFVRERPWLSPLSIAENNARLSDKSGYIQFLLTILEAEQYDLLVVTEDSILELVVSNRKQIGSLGQLFFAGQRGP